MLRQKTNSVAIRFGFTLIELLVVIAIISLLVSILLPSLNSAKVLAKRAVCLSNQHNLGQSFHMYADDDSRNQWPSAYATSGGSISGCSYWCDQDHMFGYVFPEFDNSQITNGYYQGVLFGFLEGTFFQCPASEPLMDWNIATTTYGMSRRLKDGPDSIAKPGDNMLLIDNNSTMAINEPWYTNQNYGWNWIINASLNHAASGKSDGTGGVNNTLFTDGHAETLDPEDIPNFIFDGTTDRWRTFWNIDGSV